MPVNNKPEKFAKVEDADREAMVFVEAVARWHGVVDANIKVKIQQDMPVPLTPAELTEPRILTAWANDGRRLLALTIILRDADGASLLITRQF